MFLCNPSGNQTTNQQALVKTKTLLVEVKGSLMQLLRSVDASQADGLHFFRYHSSLASVLNTKGELRVKLRAHF